MVTEIKARVSRSKIIQMVSEIEADIDELSLKLHSEIAAAERIQLEEDFIFYFNEIVAIEMHSRSTIVRSACATLIHRYAFKRSTCVNTEALTT